MGHPTQSYRYWLSCAISDGRFSGLPGTREVPENRGDRLFVASSAGVPEFFSGYPLPAGARAVDSGRKGRGGSNDERGVSRAGTSAHRARAAPSGARAGRRRPAERRGAPRAVRSRRARAPRCHLRRRGVRRGADRPAHHRGAGPLDRPRHRDAPRGPTAGGDRRPPRRPQPGQARVRRDRRDRHRTRVGHRPPDARRPGAAHLAWPRLLPARARGSVRAVHRVPEAADDGARRRRPARRAARIGPRPRRGVRRSPSS